MTLPTILLTGFDPFGGDTVNPSWQVAHALDGEVIAGHRVRAAQLPTVFDASAAALESLLDAQRPALVLALGQAGGRRAIALERVAINVNDARIPDNAGNQPIDSAVRAGGPAAYFSTLPIKAMHAALTRQGIAAEVSQSAGTFVCNHVFYALMHRLQQQGLPHGRAAPVRAGLVHVPWLPGQGVPAMPLATLVEGIRVALECALRTPADVHIGAGALH